MSATDDDGQVEKPVDKIGALQDKRHTTIETANSPLSSNSRMKNDDECGLDGNDRQGIESSITSTLQEHRQYPTPSTSATLGNDSYQSGDRNFQLFGRRQTENSPSRDFAYNRAEGDGEPKTWRKPGGWRNRRDGSLEIESKTQDSSQFYTNPVFSRQRRIVNKTDSNSNVKKPIIFTRKQCNESNNRSVTGTFPGWTKRKPACANMTKESRSKTGRVYPKPNDCSDSELISSDFPSKFSSRYRGRPKTEESSIDPQQKGQCDLYDRKETMNVTYVIADSNDRKNRKPGVNYVGFEYLEKLSKMNAEELMFEILNPDTPFTFLLDQRDLQAEWLFFVFKIISKICSFEFTNTRNDMLSQICRSEIFHCVSHYLGEVSLEIRTSTIEKLPAFMNDLIVFYSSVISFLPSVAVDKDFPKLIAKTVKGIESVKTDHQIAFDENLLSTLNTLDEKIQNHKEMLEKHLKPVHKKTYLQYLSEQAPPNDFRELDLYPTYEDLTRHTFGFVRPNKIRGAYDNVEHYLDVQFRLLREDFVDPLRRGLNQYLEAKSTASRNREKVRLKFKYESLRIYPNCVFEETVTTERGNVAFRLNFNMNKKLNIKWENSKRFMYGSLLLFTNDNFKTFFYGTVTGRDVELLTAGNILVTFPHDVPADKNFLSMEYLMAESEVFFEPYFLVMKGWKTLNEENFPMKKYIVDGISVTDYPYYMYRNNNFRLTIYGDEFHCPVNNLIECDSLNVVNWPTAEELGMDAHQRLAFMKALTTEFCIIQGPPGTGKTYIGLKIVGALLLNARLNQSYIRRPILIVCFTNHALDQFLEGILRSFYTRKVVRVGAQSKSEVLKDFNLRGGFNTKKLRRSIFAEKQIDTVTLRIRNDARMELKEVRRLIRRKKKLDKPNGILKYNILRDVMTEDQKNLLFDAETLLHWLLEDDIDATMQGENIEFDSVEIDGIDLKRQQEDKEDDMLYTSEESEDDDDIKFYVTEEFDDLFITDSVVTYHESLYEITCKELKTKINHLEYEHHKYLTKLKNYDEVNDYAAHINELEVLEIEIRNMRRKFKTVKALLTDPSCPTLPRIERVLAKDIRHLSFVERWVLYQNWIRLLREVWTQNLQDAQERYRACLLKYEDMRQLGDLFVLQQTNVVGMTTTCAARLHTLLNYLKPAVVIIEEAAEVLETHIVTSLTKSCEHVILIGDHLQLKPSSAVYQLSKDYNIDVSLFERMINNGMECPMLNVQHRMRPNISRLITPLIYVDLKDDESVSKYEDIRGMMANLFFLEHDHYEQDDVEDSASRQNVFEADFMIELCEYLLLQGYDPQKITILTTYTGQMFLLRECVVIDKYQGEENDIILLSLVRSNEEAKIGFLKTPNRVCVALSRAKMGFYVVGNMNNLAASSPNLWGNIRENLRDQNAIGDKMGLYCPRHEIRTDVSCSKDFDKVREGGCSRICDELLKCGHDCDRLCHTLDREHEETRCLKHCEKTCQKEKHKCPKRCYEDCGDCTKLVTRILACGHPATLSCYVDETEYKCDVIVDDVSPSCGHDVKRKCHEQAKDVVCARLCEDRLVCGHTCRQTCHKNEDPNHVQYQCREPCGRTNGKCSREHKCLKSCFQDCGNCTVLVTFTLECGHKKRLECSVKIEDIKCYEECEKICPNCQLRCRKKCHENCSPCSNYMDKRIDECGHNVRIRCHLQPERKNCFEECERTLECGHKCVDKCCRPCNSVPCKALIKVPDQRGICGHDFVIVPCFRKEENVDEERLRNAVKLCDAPCGVLLKCGHRCRSTCNRCWQGRLHEPCQEPCGTINICGHECKYPCRQMCPPCGEPCGFYCKHSRCSRQCGVPCKPCQQSCDWECRHLKCTKKCGEICDREPCQEACPELLECGHLCVGFCGEPHPSCRECHKEMSEIFLGYEDRDDAKFVLLEDCGHSFESKGLERYLKITPKGGEIRVKVCPTCQTPITKTQRYMNHVKKTYADVQAVKRKIFGREKTLKQRKKELYRKLLLFSTTSAMNIRATGLEKMRSMVNDYVRKVDVVRVKMNTITLAELNTIEFFCQVMVDVESRLEELCEKDNKKNMKLYEHDFVTEVVEFVNALFCRIEEPTIQICEQMSEDLALELQRYHKMVDLLQVLRNPVYVQKKDDWVVSQPFQTLKDYIFGIERFDRVELEVNKTLDDLQDNLEVPTSLTSEGKRTNINQALSEEFFNGATGHWFTCSNGHYYVIAECGGPIVRSKCPECGEVIESENQQRVLTVGPAIDMDGATRPACYDVHDVRCI